MALKAAGATGVVWELIGLMQQSFASSDTRKSFNDARLNWSDM